MISESHPPGRRLQTAIRRTPPSRIEFLGAHLDQYTMHEVVALARAAMQTRTRLQHGDVNVAKVVSFRSDPELRRYVEESDIVCADGMGLVWGCRLSGVARLERIAGVDFMGRVLEVCAQEGFRPYFLGARPDVVEQAVAATRRRHPGIEFAGWRNGYFKPDEEQQVVAEIRATGADCLFVGMSSPLKERFLYYYRDDLGVPVQLGVGGSFDVLAGRVKRAPQWVQRVGLEWAFRLVQEPLRLGPRYLKTNAQFVVMLLGYLVGRFGRGLG